MTAVNARRTSLVESFISYTFILLLIQAFLSNFGLTIPVFISPSNFLELCFFFIGIICFHPKNLSRFLTIAGIFLVFFAIIIFSILADSPIYEVLRATKWVFFIGLLFGINRKGVVSPVVLLRVTKLLLVSALFQYSWTKFNLGITSRPTLFIENNYEVALFSGFLIVSYFSNRGFNEKFRWVWFWIYFEVMLLSGSLSGLLLLILISIFVGFQKETGSRRKFIFGVFMLLLSFGSLFWVYSSRNVTLTRSDRYYFLEIFFQEMGLGNVLHWFIGNIIIRPLEVDSCNALTYYVRQLSEDLQGACFSVTFHSFILRTIVDFGIVGLFFAFFALTKSLNREVPSSLRKLLVAIAFLNSLSVSGPNNIYVIFPFLMAQLVDFSKYTERATFLKNS